MYQCSCKQCCPIAVHAMGGNWTSVSISGAEINLTLRAVTTYVLCCNLAPSMSALKMCIFSNIVLKWHFLLWIGTYCISCVVQQTSGVKDLPSLVRYDDSSLAAIRHLRSITPVVRPRPNIRSHSVLFSMKTKLCEWYMTIILTNWLLLTTLS